MGGGSRTLGSRELGQTVLVTWLDVRGARHWIYTGVIERDADGFVWCQQIEIGTSDYHERWVLAGIDTIG